MSSFVPTSGIVRLGRWQGEGHLPQVSLSPEPDEEAGNYARVDVDQKVRVEAEQRIAFHEALHYWQHISQRFLLRVTEEDWLRLKRYEADQTVLPPGPLKREFLRVDPAVGFSARDLLECLTRYWELTAFKVANVLAMDAALRGPVVDRRLAIESEIDEGPHRGKMLAMKLAAGRYGVPYLWAADLFPDKFTLAVAFPFLARVALHSSQPTTAFAAAARRAGSLAKALQPSPRSESSLVDFARELRIAVDDTLPDVRGVYVQQVEQDFWSGALATHPGYRYAFEAIRTFREKMARGAAALAPLRETLRRDVEAIQARFDATAQKVIRRLSAGDGKATVEAAQGTTGWAPRTRTSNDPLIGAHQWQFAGDGGATEHLFMYMGEELNRKILARALPPPTLVEDELSVGFGVVPRTTHPMEILIGPAPDVTPDPRTFIYQPDDAQAQTYAQSTNPALALSSLYDIARQCADIDARWRNFRAYARGY